jgi:cbb3-type cytochrome oxidase subunit 3/alpha-D-ribose 1-methylphosphonate 5-triphosphate synthase subunit PhnH
MLKKILILMLMILSSMHLFDIQANTTVLSQLPEAFQQRLYERLNNQDDNAITETKLTASDGVADDYFGYSVALDGTTLVVGAYLDDDNSGNSGSVYVYDLTKTINDEEFERKITASDAASSDYFGRFVAIDGNTLVVSSYFDDDNGSESGSVYVYDLTKNNRETGFERKITASDGAVTDRFGISVAIDGNTLAVGAYYDDDNGMNSGSVYVYDLTKINQSGFERKITASDGAEFDFFGWSVALDGTTLVVGAYSDDDNAVNSGSVYVYDLTKTIDDEEFERKIIASDGASADHFSFSIAIDGTKIVASAYNDDDNGKDSGSVYVYDLTKTPEDDGFETKITASDGAASDFFGWSVALNGTTLVVGAHLDDDNGNDSGSVYVYDLTKNIEDEGFETKITASDGASSDSFGKSVAIDGNTLVVGALYDDDNGNDSGSVYVFNGTFGSGNTDTEDPITETKLTASDGGQYDYFGFSIAIDGTTLVVGALLDDDKGPDSGSVYVYDLTKTPEDDGFETKITASDGAASDYFGVSVAIDGTTLVVGAYGDDDNGPQSGSVYVYDLTKTINDEEFERKITASDDASSDQFGQSVALNGTTLVVGAHLDNDKELQSGSVYVYDLTKTPVDDGFETKITASDGAASDFFGQSVALNGTTLVVGSFEDDDKGTGSGSVYVYDLTKTPVDDGFERKINASDGANYDLFGLSVALDGTTLVVCAYSDDDKGTNSGSVYVYNGTFGSGTTKTDEEWASEITTMIDALSEPYVRADVEAARTAYDALTPEQQALVTNYQDLLNAEQALTDQDAAAAVDAMIDALTDPYDINAIDAARDAYENLTEAQKALVTGLSDLEAAEERYADLDAASIVDGMIAALSEPYDAVAVYDARQAYDALTETQKGYVTRLPELEAAEQAVADQTAAAAVDALIDALTSPYIRADVEAAREAYDALTETQQALVKGLPDLEAAEAGLVDQALAQAVELLINTLSTPYDSDTVQTARDAYDALTETQQALVTNYQALLDAEQALADIDAAATVDSLIDALTEPYDPEAVQGARTAYDNLTEAQQALVTNYEDLLNAEQALTDINAAAAVDALIDALSEPYDSEVVEGARTAYDALTETQQALVTGLLDLETAEAAVEEQVNKEEAARIDALIQTLTEDSTEEEIEAAREAYDNLTEEQQNLVTQLPTLVTYEQQFASTDSTGLVFFMILFIGVISALIYFVFYKRNKEENEEKINE